MGHGSLLLELPGEDGLHVSPKVCVWAQESIEEQGHRALAPAFEAFRQVIQVLQRGHRSEGPPGAGFPTQISGSERWAKAAFQKELAHSGMLEAPTRPAVV